MNPLRSVGLDESLTTEQGQLIREKAVFAAKRQMVARKLCPINKIDPSTVTFGYDTLTEVSDARIDAGWPGSTSKDIINLTRSTVAIPTVHKEFEINKLDLSASRRTGTPLNVSIVESASYKVSLEEDALIIMGWSRDGTNYDINGLYKAAGNTTTGADFTTKANIESSILAALALLEADGIYPPFNMVLNSAQYAETQALIASTSRSYVDWIREVLGGEVYSTPAITATTGMITKKNAEGMFEYVLPEDLSVYMAILMESENLFGRVYVRGIPVVYDANAICTLTTI